MGRKPRVDRSPEEKWQVVQEGIKSGNVSETCRRHGIAPNLFYRWRDKRNRERKQRLGGEALPRRKPRRTIASGNWNERWGASR
jgi:transposase-like protein